MLRPYLFRVLGGILLFASVILLITAPPSGQFSAASLFGFLGCLVFGILLASGLVGTHPYAARARRQAPAVPRRTPDAGRPSIEATFAYANRSARQKLSVGLCTALGLALLTLAAVVARQFPGRLADRVLVGISSLLGGLISIYFPLRQLKMFLKVGPAGIEARLYFRSISIAWDEIVALIERENYFPMFGNVGTTFSIYTLRRRIDFTDRLTGWRELRDLVSRATGLEWRT